MVKATDLYPALNTVHTGFKKRKRDPSSSFPIHLGPGGGASSAPLSEDSHHLRRPSSGDHHSESPFAGQRNMERDDDSDRHFCLSLLGTLKRVEPRQKSALKLEIMKLLNEAAFPPVPLVMEEMPVDIKVDCDK